MLSRASVSHPVREVGIPSAMSFPGDWVGVCAPTPRHGTPLLTSSDSHHTYGQYVRILLECFLFSAYKRILGQGNVLHPCAILFRGGGLHPKGGLHPGGVGQIPPNWILRDMVNERVVRILLECILVT